MTIHFPTSGSITGLRIGPAPLGYEPISRATRLALAGLLVALALAGCSASAATASPTAAPTFAPTPTLTPTLAPTASPSPTPGFSPTGSMTAARYYHTATLLSDGRALVTGGVNGAGALASAELYQP